ncbi:MAG: choice-of-anchor D domain-containing protein [Rhodothermales bacterium]
MGSPYARVAPVAVNDLYTVVEGTTLTVAAPGVLLNDTGATSAVIETEPAHGTVVLNPDGSFVYTHDGLSTMADAFTYRAGDGVTQSAPATVTLAITPISFGVSAITGHTITQPTSLQFGPDGILYVLRKKGQINALTLERTAANQYTLVSEEVLGTVRSIVNHNDDGQVNASVKIRQGTGLVVGGTADNPVIYASSSDSRVGGQENNPDTGLDTNSGVISRIRWIGANRTDPAGYWEHVDIVRGLPRSEENHANNGMAFSVTGDTLFVAMGGFTNAGAPSNNFAYINEYALSAAIVSIDLAAVEAMPVQVDAQGQSYIYDLPTLDDPTRANANGIDDPTVPGYNGVDVNDPWGGNDGLNQAKIVPGGPVQVYSPGYRNPYDVVVTRTPGRAGRMYTIDNGANRGWGGHPFGETSYPGADAGVCTNNYDPAEPGSSNPGPHDDTVNNENGLHYVRELQPGDENYAAPGERYYAGHPSPIRGNPAGAGLYTGEYNADPTLNTGVWRDGSDPAYPLPADWPPVPVDQANPAECDFRNAGIDDGSLVVYPISTNGIAEYTASNFNNAFKGNLLAAGYNDNRIYRIALNEAGDQVLNGEEIFAENFGDVALDVTTQGDNDLFPGTIWVTGFTEHAIYVFEPADFGGGMVGECSGAQDPLLDEDGDGYDNEDEILNATNPCSAVSKPADNDGDLTSNLLDPDDDNDTVADVDDPFAIDATNGTTLDLPVDYPLLNEDPGTGFFGLGLTGLMHNGITDWLTQFDDEALVPGGTAGLFTVNPVTEGDATGATNTQDNAFQFGVNVSEATGPFSITARMPGPFFNSLTPVDNQSQGIYIGTGDMDNYVKVVLAALGGVGGFQVVHESAGVVQSSADFTVPSAKGAANIDFVLSIDPVAGTVQPYYAIDEGALVALGTARTLSGPLLSVVKGTYTLAGGVPSRLAVGLIATSAGPGPEFDATWDSFFIAQGATVPSTLSPAPADVPFGSIAVGATASHDIVLTNTSGTLPITITAVTITGDDASVFGKTLATPVTIQPGIAAILNVSFTPEAVGTFSAQVNVTHNGSNTPLQIPLSGEGHDVAGGILFRVNAGGPELVDGSNPVWEEDQAVSGGSGDALAGTPSPFVNAAATGDKTYGKNDPITLHASVPAGTPTALFQRGRWDPNSDPNMQWDIPVAAGKTVEVRLYLAEQVFTAPNDPSWATWPRQFDIAVDGTVPAGLADIDLFNTYGHDVGAMRSLVVTSDGNIDIDLINKSGDPMLQGIELIEITTPYTSTNEGWNMVGIPVATTDAAYEDVFTSVAPVIAPYGWGGSGYVQTPTVSSGRAYWLLTDGMLTQTYDGESIATAELTLTDGWNMIAGPACDVAFGAISDPSGILVPGTLFGYDGGYQSTDVVRSGRGYWVLADGAGAISLTCSAGAKYAGLGQAGDATEEDVSTFGELSVRDDAGRRQHLFFGATFFSEGDRLPFSMPPRTPRGAFDARFSGDTRAVEGEQGVIQVQSDAYPLTLAIERLPQPTHGPLVLEELIDARTVRSHPVAAGDSIVIRDPDVQAIRLTAGASANDVLPERFALTGNYPNPFNPQTQIVFDLPEQALVQVIVYDLVGRRVLETPATELAAGAGRQLTIDGTSLASGIYVYQVRASMATATEVRMGRMTLLK